MILQNFVPHPRYYGAEVAEIADEAASERWSAGEESAPAPEELPEWATEITLEDMKRLVAESKRLMPDVGIQIPPNLSDWWVDLVGEGATDLGGLSANGDHISPEHAFPGPAEVRKRMKPKGYALSERLCVYAQYLDPDWIEQGVLDVVKSRYWSFIPRKGSGRNRDVAIDPDTAPAAIERGRAGEPLSEEELTALFAEARPDVIEAMRLAADGLRAELAGETATVRRQPQRQFHQHLRRRLRLLRLRPGQALARRLPPERGRFPGPRQRGGRRRGHRDLHAGRDPPRLHPRALRPLARAGEGGRAAAPPARVLADGGRLHVRALGPFGARCVRVPARVRPRLDPGNRRRGSPRRRPRPDLAEQAAGRALGRDHRGLPPEWPALDLHGDVRPHRGARPSSPATCA